MDRNVSFQPRRGGNAGLLRLLFIRPTVIRFARGPLRGYYRKWFHDVAGLLPTERETKVMSHGRSISVLPNDMVARIMFSRSPCCFIVTIVSPEDYRRGIDDVVVGEIFHSAMRESLCAAGGPLFPARLANRCSDNTWATTHGWARQGPRPGRVS